MIQCVKCDHFNLADASACERCGHPLGDEAATAPPSSPESIQTQVLAIAGTTGKIAAIKYYREKTGVGLKDAKEAVERLLEQHNVKAASGCAVLLALLTLSGLAAGTFVVLTV